MRGYYYIWPSLDVQISKRAKSKPQLYKLEIRHFGLEKMHLLSIGHSDISQIPRFLKLLFSDKYSKLFEIWINFF